MVSSLLISIAHDDSSKHRAVNCNVKATCVRPLKSMRDGRKVLMLRAFFSSAEIPSGMPPSRSFNQPLPAHIGRRSATLLTANFLTLELATRFGYRLMIKVKY